MKVTLIWDDGKLTRLQGANALKIAQNWLYKYVDLLAVFCTTNQTIYLKEGKGRMIYDNYNLSCE